MLPSIEREKFLFLFLGRQLIASVPFPLNVKETNSITLFIEKAIFHFCKILISHSPLEREG